MLYQMEKHIALLCNPLAGAGKAVKCSDEIAAGLSAMKISYTLFKEIWPEHLNDFTDVFIAGGDGTLNYFLNKYPLPALPVVIFKGGTGNDFHWLLYGDKTFSEQLQTVCSVDPKPIDIGLCNDRYFINGVGIGFEGEVARALTGIKKLPGKTSFLLTVLQKIVSYRSKYYTVKTEHKSVKGKKLLINISNGRRAGGGFHIAPEAKADDGLFDIVIASSLSLLQRLYYLPVIEKGKHLGLEIIDYFRSNNIRIESNTRLQYHLDGEYFEAEKISIQILPSALQFRY